MSEVSKNSAFIFRLSSPDPFECILYTDGGAYFIISSSTASSSDAFSPSALLTPPTSPTSASAPKRGSSLAGNAGDTITICSARGLGELVGTIRHTKMGQWEIAFGPEESRGTPFGKFFGIGVLGKVMGQKPKVRDTEGGVWTWQGYRSSRDLYLVSPTNEVAAQFRPADSTRIADPNAALIVYSCAFDIKELVLVSWLALERVQRDEEQGKKGKQGKRGSGEWRSMSLGGQGK
ncbi:hypothetical protein CALCODRAFT_505975 [Calocera cornea HHB12733]|uniref:Uncharacterized protein n=1 Tax=Calocera cornea HHB12733 TaxID=1353952 RepID=A0A165JJ16_9BASI|nr:hypothetical protein CALCODRAFT_505975 [Calocera cornea HHB12733]